MPSFAVTVAVAVVPVAVVAAGSFAPSAFSVRSEVFAEPGVSLLRDPPGVVLLLAAPVCPAAVALLGVLCSISVGAVSWSLGTPGQSFLPL